MFSKIKNKKRLGIIFIVFAILIGSIIMYNHAKEIQKTKAETDQSTEKEPEQEVKVVEPAEQEKPENMEVSAIGIPEDALKMINGKEKELQEAIQIWANSYGYRDEENAHFEGSVTIDYNQNTVSISFYLQNENHTKFDVIYDKKTESFSVVPW